MGDFNEILSLSEKTGSTTRPLLQMEGFQKTLDDCGLFGINFKGFPYTWKRGREGGMILWESLDRGVMNVEFAQLWSRIIIHHVDNTVSDHKALVLEGSTNNEESSPRRALRFHFETMWMKEDNFEEVVKGAWDNSNHMNIVTQINSCASQLDHWSRHSFKSITKEIRQCKQEIAALNLVQPTTEQEKCLQETSRTLEKLLEQEELMWAQRSRVCWLKDGDKNTRFFHERAKARGKKKIMHGIYDGEGNWRTKYDHIAAVFEAYFSQLF